MGKYANTANESAMSGLRQDLRIDIQVETLEKNDVIEVQNTSVIRIYMPVDMESTEDVRPKMPGRI